MLYIASLGIDGGFQKSGEFHGRELDTLEAKARWFQSLSLEERMEYLCAVTDLVLENQPRLAERTMLNRLQAVFASFEAHGCE